MMAQRENVPMLKATKLALAATFLAGSCGLAMAQGSGASGSGADKSPSSTGADKNPTDGTMNNKAPMT